MAEIKAQHSCQGKGLKDQEQGLVTVAGRGAHLNKAPYDMLQLRVSFEVDVTQSMSTFVGLSACSL